MTDSLRFSVLIFRKWDEKVRLTANKRGEKLCRQQIKTNNLKYDVGSNQASGERVLPKCNLCNDFFKILKDDILSTPSRPSCS